MKINIEIPDFPELNQRAIYIMAGSELIAKTIGGEWMIKTIRCDLCGKCCMNLDSQIGLPLTDDGTCKHLERRPGKDEKYLCGLGIERHFSCAIFDPFEKDYCHEEFEAVA